LADGPGHATIAAEGEPLLLREDDGMAVPQTLEPSVLPDAGPPPVTIRETLLAPGTRVDLRKRLDGEWARGFEVVASTPEGYRVRRLSDGGELPLLFSDDDVRKEKKRGTWWY
jgi:hypothetical protein